jgi:predicted dehydrogenase
MEKKISIGVIGCGIRIHSLLSRLLPLNSRLTLEAVHDPLPERMTLFQKDFNTNLISYSNEQDLYKHKNLDWLIVGSWNCYHRRQVEAGLNTNLNIFCEKPLATTIDDILDLVKLSKSSSKKIMIGFTLRYSRHYHKIKELVDSGAIGQLVSFEFNETLDFNHGGYIMRDWRREVSLSGGNLLEKCCHDIDLANWIVNSLPVKIASFGGRNIFKPENKPLMDELGSNQDNKAAYCTWFANGTPLEHPFTGAGDVMDNQVVIMEYENGVRSTFHTNMNAGIPERRMYLLGTKGAIRADVLTGQIELKRIGFNTITERMDIPTASGGHGGADTFVAQSLAEMMISDKESQTPLLDGATSAIVALKADESIQTGKVVNLSDIWAKIFQN